MTRKRRKPCAFCPQGITTSTQFYPIKESDCGFKLGMNDLLLSEPTKELKNSSFVCHRHFKMNLRLQKNVTKKRSIKSDHVWSNKRIKKFESHDEYDEISDLNTQSDDASDCSKSSSNSTTVIHDSSGDKHLQGSYPFSNLMYQCNLVPDSLQMPSLKRPIPVRVSVGCSYSFFET